MATVRVSRVMDVSQLPMHLSRTKGKKCLLVSGRGVSDDQSTYIECALNDIGAAQVVALNEHRTFVVVLPDSGISEEKIQSYVADTIYFGIQGLSVDVD